MASVGEWDELFNAHAHICNHLLSFVKTMTLKCAIQLGIPDVIHKHDQPMTIDKLIDALPIHPSKSHALIRLMRILVHYGFLDMQKTTDLEDGYVSNNSTLLLLKDNPYSVGSFALSIFNPYSMRSWQCLSSWYKSDAPTPHHIAYEMDLWQVLSNNPNYSQMFNDTLARDASLVSKVLLDRHKGVFEGIHTLVDIGGGTGNLVKKIAEAFPSLECIVFDLPFVVVDLVGSNNLKYVGGNMFEEIPPGDAYLLKAVLHDWSDEQCVKILKKCKEAINQCKSKKGKVIVIEIVMEKHKEDKLQTETELLFDMLMMATTTGKERNEKEWAKLFIDAGFSDYNIVPLMGIRCLIEIYP